jgi:membrane-bound lytic murein transglycosylase D
MLSPHLIAQNSALVFNDRSFSNSDYRFLDTYKISVSNLLPIDQNLQKKAKNLLLVTNSTPLDSFDSDNFSSLILKEQLKKLDHSTPFKVVHNATLERFIRVHLRDRKAYLNRLIHKSIYYFPIFEEQLDAYDLPLELKYLAVVESALNPVAISPSGAKGLWQFMYGTGIEYDLYIDSYIDERFDILKSTRAACSYLKNLYKSFGSWDLALAAYNSGPGNVRKAIKRAGGNTNYWEIRQFLPRETSSYVPAFYATMYLFTHAENHGLSPVKTDLSYFETDTIQLKGSLTFKAIEKNTGIDVEVLRSFNPIYKKDLIPALKDKTMSLTLPVSLMPGFIASEKNLYHNAVNLEDIYTTSKVIPISEFNSYLVTDGDNLNSIAKKHHISLKQLKTWNGLDSNFLISGQRLVVTDSKQQFSSNIKKDNSQEPKLTQTVQNKNELVNYTVEHGDTLFKISRKFGNIPITELRVLNDLDNVNYLKPGTTLKIKKRTPEHQS